MYGHKSFDIDKKKNASENSKYPEFWSSFVVVETSSMNFVTLKKTVDKKLSEPYNSCAEYDAIQKNTSVLIQETIKYNNFYNRNICLHLCYFKYLSQKFNCSISNLYGYKDAPSCPEHLGRNDISSTKCYDQCPTPCSTSSISYQVEKFIDKTLGDSFLLEIDYDDYRYLLTSQIPKSKLPDLGAKLGGLLGLFVGLKFLSFIEIIEFM